MSYNKVIVLGICWCIFGTMLLSGIILLFAGQIFGIWFILNSFSFFPPYFTYVSMIFGKMDTSGQIILRIALLPIIWSGLILPIVPDSQKGSPIPTPKLSSKNIEILDIKLDKETENITNDSEIVFVPTGVKRTIKKSRVISRTVTLNNKNLFSSEIQANIQLISIQIKNTIEKSEGKELKTTETIDQEVSIEGIKYSRFELSWVDKYQSGTIKIKVGGKNQYERFSFLKGTELRIAPF
jgi:hypothetical protein